VFRVNAVLKSARDVRPETMDAIVHFATGDVTVELTRQGGGAAYHAWVPVPEDEPEGVVLIDATAEVDGETVEASGAGKILDRGEGAEEDEIDEPEELQEPDASPEPCEPEESPEPNPSGDPDASPSPSAEASPSGDPEPSPSDDGDGDGNESPDPSGSPDAEETAEEDCDAADDDATQLTMAVLARIIAYIESLMA
jgi:outer membrane biosynthesis protein TonB